MDENPRDPHEEVADQVFVGMCHHLNSQLAAANAYVFLLRRRGRLEEYDAPLQEQMDRLARSVQLLRSLCIDGEPRTEPVAMSQLAETATEIMKDHPGGPVLFVPAPAVADAIVRLDWSRGLRALLEAASWAARDCDDTVELSIDVDESAGTPVIRIAPPDGLHEPTDGRVPAPRSRWGFRIRYTGSRSAELELLV